MIGSGTEPLRHMPRHSHSKSPGPIPGGRASRRAQPQGGSDGASPSPNHAKSLSPQPDEARVQIEPSPASASAGSGVDDEFWVLTTDVGRRVLSEVAAVRSIHPADLARFRRLAGPGAVSAAVRLSQARRKAVVKFERGPRMWVDPTGVEQSTAEPVARHKAARFTAGSLVVDLCAGIG